MKTQKGSSGSTFFNHEILSVRVAKAQFTDCSWDSSEAPEFNQAFQLP